MVQKLLSFMLMMGVGPGTFQQRRFFEPLFLVGVIYLRDRR
jgi:hypothetical protein